MKLKGFHDFCTSCGLGVIGAGLVTSMIRGIGDDEVFRTYLPGSNGVVMVVV
jgi:hypothetical protein